MSDDPTDVDDFIARENERRGRGDPSDAPTDARDFVNAENERRGRSADFGEADDG